MAIILFSVALACFNLKQLSLTYLTNLFLLIVQIIWILSNGFELIFEVKYIFKYYAAKIYFYGNPSMAYVLCILLTVLSVNQVSLNNNMYIYFV